MGKRTSIILVLAVSWAILRPFLADASEGPGGTGGGNSSVPGKLTKDEFESWVNNGMGQVLNLVFETMELDKERTDVSLLGRRSISESDQKVVNGIRKKLFSGQDNIYKKLKEAQLDLQMKPCIDLARQERDGSANIETNSICLSYDRLSRKLRRDDYALYMTALAAHEYSHLMGTTEIEALRIQHEILDQVSLGDWTGSQILNFSSEMERPDSGIQLGIDAILKSIEQDALNGLDDQGTLCSRLDGINIYNIEIANLLHNVRVLYGVFIGGSLLSSDYLKFVDDFGVLEKQCDSVNINPKLSIGDLKALLNTMKAEMNLIFLRAGSWGGRYDGWGSLILSKSQVVH